MFREYYEKIKEKITDFFKIELVSYFKYRMNRLRAYREYRKCKKIKIKPYTVTKGLVSLVNIPSGNIQQMNAVLELSIEANNIGDYDSIFNITSLYLHPYGVIRYRDYFLGEDDGSFYYIDYQKAWITFIENRRKLKNKIYFFERNLLVDPNRYYYVNSLKKILNLSNDLFFEIMKIESK